MFVSSLQPGKMQTGIKCLTLGLTLLTAVLYSSGEKISVPTVAELDALIEKHRQCHKIVALSASIVAHNQEFIYTGGFGAKNLESNEKATNETLFCIGSITKQFTAILLLHLLRLSRNKGYNYNETTLLKEIDRSLDFEGSNLRDVTIEDILSHRSGIAEVTGTTLVGYSTNLTRAALTEITARTPRIRRNREMFHYNNQGITVAGHIAEVLGRLLLNKSISWESLVQEYLLAPLGISQDVEFADISKFERIATPYFSVRGDPRGVDLTIMELIKPMGPAGSMCISANAMIHWMKFLLNQGSSEGTSVVASEDIRNSWRERISMPVEHPSVVQPGTEGTEGLIQTIQTGYALGWFTAIYRGYPYVEHSGTYNSYKSFLTVLPQLNISIYSSTNGPGTGDLDLRSLHHAIFDRLMGFPSVYQNGCKNQSEVTPSHIPTKNASSTLDSEKYVGVYNHPVHGHLEIQSVDDQLSLLVGRFGNASINCRISATDCELKFEGIVWWLSESDAYWNGAEREPSIFFTEIGGRVKKVSLPWWSSAPSDFELIPDNCHLSEQVVICIDAPDATTTSSNDSMPSSTHAANFFILVMSLVALLGSI